jgi:2-keto-4-pentenoate hydratase/2-oxohepta-3-ene-1,7-dioic acid hydratase in catechol pathway
MKIICIGRNYADHAAEMNAEVPSAPVFFMKPDTAVLKDDVFYFPGFTNEIHYECELVVKIDRVGKHIDPAFAHKYYSHVGLGIDFTARDLQAECKAKGLPWEIAKAFDQSAVVSSQWIPITPKAFDSLSFEFHQNGVLKQHGNPTMMLFNIDQIIEYISKFITLKTGDLIFTGTPAGVGPIAIGDELVGTLNGQEMYRISVK